jgi:hypothetical protein
MKTSSLIWLVAAIVVVLSLLAVRFYPSVQAFMASNTLWNGIHGFSDKHQTSDLLTLNDLPGDSTSSVLVAVPYMDYTQDDLDSINAFVTQGNLLVILDDFGYGNRVLQRLGLSVRFNGKILLDPLFCYKNANLPRIAEFDPALSALGIQAVALNHATCLDNSSGGRVLAWSSVTSFIDSNGNGAKDASEKYGPFPVAAEYQVGQGLVRIVSDPSLIINTMQEQNDNSKFADYLLSYPQTAAVYVDYSHISQAPLDTGKRNLEDFRVFLDRPYVTIVLIAAVFALAAFFILKKGEIFG